LYSLLKKKADDLITARKYFQGEKIISTNSFVNLAKKGTHKINQHLEGDAKFK